jgi:hypothetical protein
VGNDVWGSCKFVLTAKCEKELAGSEMGTNVRGGEGGRRSGECRNWELVGEIVKEKGEIPESA